jgi:hypothetical protein
MSDWYARKLAELQGAPLPSAPAPVQPPQYPPTAPLGHPGALPAHMAPYAPPPQPAAAPQTPGAHVGAQPGQVPQAFYSYNAETGAQVADDGHVAALYNSAATTGGSQLVKSNSTTCPNCNGGNYFTVQEGGVFSKATGTTVRAMQCADCGFPKVQAGSTGGALAGQRGGGGPAKAARQLPANHRVTVAVEGGGTATFEPPTGAR